jgi:hypothetical protein
MAVRNGRAALVQVELTFDPTTMLRTFTSKCRSRIFRMADLLSPTVKHERRVAEINAMKLPAVEKQLKKQRMATNGTEPEKKQRLIDHRSDGSLIAALTIDEQSLGFGDVVSRYVPDKGNLSVTKGVECVRGIRTGQKNVRMPVRAV